MKNLILFISLSVIILTSCSPKYYSANTQNVPLISAKAEKNITVSGNGNQVELQGGFEKLKLQLQFLNNKICTFKLS